MDVVGDIMTKRVITCTPKDTLLEIQNLMVRHRISRVVVADMEKKPVGVITLTDVTMMSSLLKPAKVIREKKPVFLKGILFPPKGIHLLAAKDFMTADPISVNEGADLADAAKLMAKKRIKKLPVMSNEKLVGIVTLTDIVTKVPTMLSIMEELVRPYRRSY